jgi:hypothetical protein
VNRRPLALLAAAALAVAVAASTGWAGAQESPTSDAPTTGAPPTTKAPAVSTTFPWCAPWAAQLPSWPSWLPYCADLGGRRATNDPTATVPQGSGGSGTSKVTAPPPKPVNPEQPPQPIPPPPGGWPVRSIVFPTVGPVTFEDDFGACRDGCRRFHIGNDVIGTRLQPLVAAADGWVTHLVLNHPTAGWGLVITDLDGWDYRYYHVNNDSPGTDDGSNPVEWRLAPGVTLGTPVRAGQLVAYMGDSGNSEYSVPHLHFEIHRPDGSPIDPYDSLRQAEDAARCFWLPGLAELPGRVPPTDSHARVVDVPTKTGNGTFTVSADGSIFLSGDARSVGWSKHRVGTTCPGLPTLTPTPGALAD